MSYIQQHISLFLYTPIFHQLRTYMIVLRSSFSLGLSSPFPSSNSSSFDIHTSSEHHCNSGTHNPAPRIPIPRLPERLQHPHRIPIRAPADVRPVHKLRAGEQPLGWPEVRGSAGGELVREGAEEAGRSRGQREGEVREGWEGEGGVVEELFVVC